MINRVETLDKAIADSASGLEIEINDISAEIKSGIATVSEFITIYGEKEPLFDAHILYIIGGNGVVDEASVLVERLVCLRDDVVILNVSGHINVLIEYTTCLLVNSSVRSFDKAVFIDSCKRCEI